MPFADHTGVEWDALEVGLGSQRAEARAMRSATGSARPAAPAKVVGSSTITQQLANLLSGERNLTRKAQNSSSR